MIVGTRPEARRATHEQGELWVKPEGGPHPLTVRHEGMTCV